MNFKPLLSSILFVCLFATISANGQTKLSSGGGTMKFSFHTGPLASAAKKDAIRKYVWEHWTAKSKGKIRAAHYNMHGQQKITEFRIGRDSKKRWFVEARVFWKAGFFVPNTTEVEHVTYF